MLRNAGQISNALCRVPKIRSCCISLSHVFLCESRCSALHTGFSHAWIPDLSVDSDDTSLVGFDCPSSGHQLVFLALSPLSGSRFEPLDEGSSNPIAGLERSPFVPAVSLPALLGAMVLQFRHLRLAASRASGPCTDRKQTHAICGLLGSLGEASSCT